MGLIIFRILWGFFGGRYARFGQFFATPQIALQELKTFCKLGSKSNIKKEVGHSALGGYAVLALLGIPLFMAMSGTMSNDDILFDGPLAHLMPNISDKATSLHHIGEKLLYIILAMHIGAILTYKFVKKRSLTKAMVTGKADDIPARSVDGSISTNRSYFGLFLMLACVTIAQSITFLRPASF